MDRLIYTAYSGLRGALAAQSVIANNLANANTIGYRADRVAFESETLKAGEAFQVRSQSTMGVKDADMTQGAVIQTGRPLDLSINGTAMMAVQAEDGVEAYTRRGDLSISPTGMLQTGDGRLVLGNNGPISIPASSDVSITADGTVQMVPPGGDPTNPVPIDRIKLVSTDGTKFHKSIDGLFRAVAGGIMPPDLDAKVTAGTLEQSNVSSAQMMIEMIENQRSYDIRTKLLSTARDLDTDGSALMRIS